MNCVCVLLRIVHRIRKILHVPSVLFKNKRAGWKRLLVNRLTVIKLEQIECRVSTTSQLTTVGWYKFMFRKIGIFLEDEDRRKIKRKNVIAHPLFAQWQRKIIKFGLPDNESHTRRMTWHNKFNCWSCARAHYAQRKLIVANKFQVIIFYSSFALSHWKATSLCELE